MEWWLASAGLGGLAGGFVVLVLVLTRPVKKCPGCGASLPRFRIPASLRQALWGGQTCSVCGCEVDARGRQKEG